MDLLPAGPPPDMSFVDRLQAFAVGKTSFNNAYMQAASLVSTDPGGSLPEIDALLVQIATLEATELGLIKDAGTWANSTPDACRAQWQRERTMILGFRWMAAHQAGLREEILRTSVMAHTAFENAPGDPFWATIDEQDAETATDFTTREALLDRAFGRRMASDDFLGASRNRMRASALAGDDARLERKNLCALQAISVAREHKLRRELISFSISRYTFLLVGDQSGAALEELRHQLDFVTKPIGKLARLLDETYEEALATLRAPTNAETAAEAVHSFGLIGEANTILQAQDAAMLSSSCAQAASALQQQKKAQYLDLFLLSSGFKGRRGDYDTPIETILPEALTLAFTPQQLCRVHSAFADAWEGKGKSLRAVASASDAFEAVRFAGPPTTRAQAEARLNTLRAQVGGVEAALKRDPALDVDDYVTRRSQAALAAMAAQDPNGAIATMGEVLPLALSIIKRAELLSLRGAALYDLNRFEDAERDLASAAATFSAAYDANPSLDGNLLAQRETAYLLLAFVHARLGNALEAWTNIERARAYVLRRKLGFVEFDWNSLRAALLERKAALIDICVLRWGTLAITAGPEDEAPTAVFCSTFRSSDVNRLLERPKLGDDSDKWTEVLMSAMPELSLLLMPLLEERLEFLTKHAELLFVVTDGPLAHAPLAALETSSGKSFAEMLPFAMLPFASILSGKDTRGTRAYPQSAEALAFGKDTQQFDFTEHLTTLAAALGMFSAVSYAGPAATAAALREGLAGSPILYLSSHGTLNHEIADVDRASSLILADAVVSSADVAGWACTFNLGDATLTFLNACQSGRFRPLTRTEMGGFPAALLVQGRRTLIAPLTHVEPHAAVKLADLFLREVRSGASATQALRAARLSLKNEGLPPAVWAAHQVFGLDSQLALP